LLIRYWLNDGRM